MSALRARGSGARRSADRREAVFRERFDQVDAPRLHRRQEAECDARDDRHAGRKGHHAKVQRDVGHPREICRQQRRQGAVQPRRAEQADEAAEEAEEHVLDEELARQPAAAGAERRADRDLAAARGRAGELDARDVGGRGGEEERDGHEEDDDRLADLAGHRVEDGDGRDLHRPSAAEDGDGRQPRIRRAAAARAAFGGGLRRRDARLRAARWR